jgi:hypothetical protein
MKKLLAGCTSKPAYTPTQEKIIKLAQHLEPDSARYVPLRFGKPVSFTKGDSLRPTLEQYEGIVEDKLQTMRLAETALELAIYSGRKADIATSKERYNKISKEWSDWADARTSLVTQSTDKVVGQDIAHSWRVGERVDSAHFVVFNNGDVKRLKSPAPSLE